jgi:hypothetical protein
MLGRIDDDAQDGEGQSAFGCDPPDDVAFHIRGGGTALNMKCALFADAS